MKNTLFLVMPIIAIKGAAMLRLVIWVCSMACLTAHFAEDVCSYVNSHPEPDLLLYNRMPKCGSSTIDNIIKKTSRDIFVSLNHSYWGTLDASPVRLANMQDLIRSYHYNRKRTFVAGHFHYIDFKPFIFGAQHIEHINVIRDCEGRYKSEFFYALQDSVAATVAKKDGTYDSYLAARLGRPNISIHECMENDVCITEAVKQLLRPNNTLRFFCGKQCEDRYHGNLYAAAVAHLSPFAVDGGYTAVGLTERMQETLRIFECFYPTYFRHAVQHYRNEPIIKNAGHYQPTSPTFERLIKSLCHERGKDSELYAVAEQRFDELLNHIKQNPTCCRKFNQSKHRTYLRA